MAIVFGFILTGDYGKLGSGIAMVWGLIGGILMIIQAFRQRKA